MKGVRGVQAEDYNQIGQLSENIHRLLSEKECAIFDKGLADYHRRRNVKIFVECLSLVLNTGLKRKLLISIRDAYVKPSDLSKFNQLVQAHGLATSHRQKLKGEEKGNTEGIRKLEVKRDTDGQWGFSIRGGSEHGIGIFVSWIEPGSNAEKCGLQVGDQILKANDTNLDRINHYDAVTLIKSAKKLRLFVLAHGRVPGSRMAHKVYHWVDPEGRPASPPPDPFEVQDNSKTGDYKLTNEADERKVTVIIDQGKELGISIRGGIEHGLGIYISSVETDSVAESYGLKIGDQILEVNGISFLGIVHADAANALRAQSCMVMKIKDVGKLPYSRVTAYSQTKWYPTEPGKTVQRNKLSPEPVFKAGVGSQMMLGQQQESLLQGHGLLKDVAQSVLSEQEVAIFMYHLNQYQKYDLPIDELLPPILNMLDTPEKLHLLTELRGVIQPHDIERFNELTVHKEIMAKKHQTTSPRTEDRGLDMFPQKLSPQTPLSHFTKPPPPTSTPGGDDTWNSTWNSTNFSSIHTPHTNNASVIEARVRSETETRMKNEFMEKQKTILEEQQRLLEAERTEKEATLRREREKMEEELREREEQIRAEMEDKIRQEMEQQRSIELDKKEKELQEERERRIVEEQEKEEQIRLLQEKTKAELEEKIWKEAEERIREEYEQKRQQEKEASLQRKSKVSEKAAAWDVEGRIRRDLESRIKREYEEKLKFELDKLKRQEEKEKQERQENFDQKLREEQVALLEAEEQSRIEMEDKIRRETETKVRAEYEARLQHETEEKARLAEEVKIRKAAEERLQKAKTEIERARENDQKEFERKQDQMRKAAEERLQKEKIEREKARENDQKEFERKQDQLKKAQESKKRVEDEDAQDDSDDYDQDGNEGFSVEDDTPAPGSSDQYSLQQQRLKRVNEEREEERLQQQELLAAEKEKQRQENAQMKKKELERKREENLRRREEEKKQKELLKKKEQEKKRELEKERELERFEKQKEQERLEKERELERLEKQKELERLEKQRELEKEEEFQQRKQTTNGDTGSKNTAVAKVKVNFNDEESGSMKKRRAKKAKADSIENERRKAEEKLQRRIQKAQEKKPKSYAGFTDLEGEILHINVTKIVKKLGIAIDGGANTKQKAVIIREISPEGCAAQTGMGMAVNQQILEVNGKSLFGLKHREVVMVIKEAFDGPLNKVIEFVVLDQ